MKMHVFKGFLLGTVALAAMTLPVSAQTVDAAKLNKLQQIIEQQQKMIKAQTETLESLTQQVESIRAATRSNTETMAKSEQAVKQAVRKVEQAATPPKMLSSGKSQVKLALSGQVSRVTFVADDGTESDVFHSDNEASSTRWRLVGSSKLTDDVSMGLKYEADIGQTNNSSGVSIGAGTTSAESSTGTSIDHRKLEVYVDSKKMGRLYMGKGDTPANNIAQIDLSGTSLAEYSGLGDIGGGLDFRTKGSVTADGPRVSGGSDALGSGVYSQFDGLSRRNRFEYNTPTIAGFKAGISTMQGDAWDVSLRYSAMFKDIGLKASAGIAYWDHGERSDAFDDGLAGSVSVLHNTGLNLTVSSGRLDRVATTIDDPVGWFVKPGWQLKLVPWGKTNVSFHVASTDDLQAQGDDFSSWGLAAVQNIDKAAAEVFAFYRQFDLDRTGSNFEEIDLGGIGVRMKF